MSVQTDTLDKRHAYSRDGGASYREPLREDEKMGLPYSPTDIINNAAFRSNWENNILSEIGNFGTPNTFGEITPNIPGFSSPNFSESPFSNPLSSNFDNTFTNAIQGSNEIPATSSGFLSNLSGVGAPAVAAGIAGAMNLGSTSSAGSWWDNFWTHVIDYSQRFGLILLGIVLIGAAAWALSREGGLVKDA